tara:strand:+ start:3366 stop:5396 length:2031 start_codon:yes stop_codon:yes gene_type:complete
MNLIVKKYILKILFFTFFFCHLAYSENWFTSSADYFSSKYSKLDQINSDNISQLKNAWIFKNGYAPSKKEFFYNNQSTPIFTGNSLIVTSLDNFIISLNPETGLENWRLKIDSPGPVARRGITFHEGNIFVPSSKGIFVLNEKKGTLNKKFGLNGIIGVDEQVISLVPPVLNDDKIYIIYKSFITSHKIPSGELIWKKDLNGSRVWSGVSFDKSSNTIIFVTSNLIDLVGNTQINNDYSNSLVLIDAVSGKTKCKFKDTLHDHWDLDMVGDPIVTMDDKKRIVYGFSKTGNTFIVNLETCNLLNKNFIKQIEVENNSPIEDQHYSDYQIKVTNPVNLMDLKYDLESYLDYIKNDDENIEYINHRTRNSRFGDEYIPLSFDYDVIMFGLHGGPEWPGGSYDINNSQIVIPTNHYPWIIRSYYGCCVRDEISRTKRKVEEFFTSLREIKGLITYKNHCASCHGKNKNGLYLSETVSDKYIPSLNGISRMKKFDSLESLEKFEYSHKYTTKIKLEKKEIKNLKNYFINRDNYLFRNDLLQTRAVWQLLLDKNGNFASKPPYGKITSFSTLTGKKNWQIPFGEKVTLDNKRVQGDMNFGGLLSTKGNIVFATGTTNNKVYAYNSKNGKFLWEFKLEYAGSSPPMTYQYNGTQYLIVNSSGGKYYGYDDNFGDKIYAFKIN